MDRRRPPARYARSRSTGLRAFISHRLPLWSLPYLVVVIMALTVRGLDAVSLEVIAYAWLIWSAVLTVDRWVDVWPGRRRRATLRPLETSSEDDQ